jgi:tetratricopeptide (TPR) repeat protein
MKRTIVFTLLAGTAIGASGCQSTSLGGLALWNRNHNGAGSTAPDVGQQKFGGLAQNLGHDQPRALGSTPTPSNDGFLMASWKKTTAAVSGAVAVKPKVEVPEDDPLRLDRMPKKIGPEVYVGAARLLENQGNFAEAEGKYREALRAMPNDLSALVGVARLYDRQGEPQKAIDAYQKAIAAHPAEGLIYNDLGLCYRRQRQLDKSVVAFRKATELQSDNAKYRNNLAAALVDTGRIDEAYQELTALNSPAVAHYNLAYLLQQHQRHADAIRHLQEAIRLDPGLASAQEMLSQLSGGTAPASAATQPAAMPSAALRTSSEPSGAPYSQGATDQSLYTAAPAIAPPASSYHIGDDSAAAAQMTRRTDWGAGWSLPATDTRSGNQPLPPVD